MSSQSFWTEDRIATMTRMWMQGASGRMIGAEIGTSRNAVISKVNRLGIAKQREDQGMRDDTVDGDVVEITAREAAAVERRASLPPTHTPRQPDRPTPPPRPGHDAPGKDGPLPGELPVDNDEDDKEVEKPTPRPLQRAAPVAMRADLEIADPHKAADGSDGIPLFSAPMTACKYPLWREGTPIEQKNVCGCRVVENKSWCPAHFKRVFEPERPRRRLGL